MTGLVLQRVVHDSFATQGDLSMGDERICRTLENRPPHVPGVKEPGKSRIPAGDWKLGLRAEGGFFSRYTGQWHWHGAMVEILLPDWKYVLFHVGNYHTNTAGCVLVGESFGDDPTRGLTVWSSMKAYQRVYPLLLAQASMGAALSVRDEE